MKKILKLVGLGIFAIVLLFMIDPGIKRTVKFGNFSKDYKWFIFDNAYCNIRTHGHCSDNNFNKINAELGLWKILAENYNGEPDIKEELEYVVLNRYHLKAYYSEVLKIQEVKVDSIIKYKDFLFEPMHIE